MPRFIERRALDKNGLSEILFFVTKNSNFFIVSFFFHNSKDQKWQKMIFLNEWEWINIFFGNEILYYFHKNNSTNVWKTLGLRFFYCCYTNSIFCLKVIVRRKQTNTQKSWKTMTVQYPIKQTNTEADS